MVELLVLIIMSVFMIAFFAISIKDIVYSFSNAPTEAVIACAIITCIGALYIFLRIRQDSTK